MSSHSRAEPAGVVAPWRPGPATAWFLLGLAGMLAWAGLASSAHGLAELPTCALRHAFGVGCATCGFARAAVQLAQGDLGASWALHPFALVISVEATAGWVAWGAGLWRRRPVIPDRWWARTLVATAVAAVAVWLVRLATGTIPI